MYILDQPPTSGQSAGGNPPHGVPSSVASNLNSAPQTTGGTTRKFENVLCNMRWFLFLNALHAKRINPSTHASNYNMVACNAPMRCSNSIYSLKFIAIVLFINEKNCE